MESAVSARYVSDLEEMLIQVIAAFGIKGRRFEGHRGVWIDSAAGPNKIAAVGIHVNAKGISSHGFALNVNPNLNHFSGIVPCGITDYGVTSMSAVLGDPLSTTRVLPHVKQIFSDIFREKSCLTPLQTY